MGLLEQVESGIPFTRQTVSLAIGPAGNTGQIQSFGGTFLLLSAISNQACRIRLYSDSASIGIDAARSTSSFVINDSVGLIADIVLNTSLSLTLNPPIIGATFLDGNAWYNVTGSVPLVTTTVLLGGYQLAAVGDSIYDRTTLRIPLAGVGAGNSVSGSISSSKSFLILSASATTESRLRLYSRPLTEILSGEKSRGFTTQSSVSSSLIADMMFDSASFAYKLIPSLEAFTWQNNTYINGTGELSYILENRTASTTNITASLYVYKLEE